MQTQYYVFGYRTDLYFYDNKLAIDVYELVIMTEILKEIERQKAIEKELGCKIIRINPDEQNFNIFQFINEIHKHIKKSFKKSLIDKI